MTRPPEKTEIIPVNLLLGAYASGFFPMSEPGEEEVRWYFSDPAALIPPDSYSLPRSLKQFMKKCTWRITSNRAFSSVIRACRDRRESWISNTIINSYEELHRVRHAHSVEVREDEKLIGGLYGVTLGSAFFGESMFHTKTNASKAALAALLQGLSDTGFTLIDIQMMTPVMRQFGAVIVPRDTYLQRLKKALEINCTFPFIDNMAGNFVH